MKNKVEYLETHYRTGYDEELFQTLKGKDLILYDEFHGVAHSVKKATVEILAQYVDSYTTIIII